MVVEERWSGHLPRLAQAQARRGDDLGAEQGSEGADGVPGPGGHVVAEVAALVRQPIHLPHVREKNPF
jgi:hypothetical protein